MPKPEIEANTATATGLQEAESLPYSPISATMILEMIQDRISWESRSNWRPTMRLNTEHAVGKRYVWGVFGLLSLELERSAFGGKTMRTNTD